MEDINDVKRYTVGTDADGDQTMTFKCRDLATYGVMSEDGNEFLATISGFGLTINFNMRLINSLEDAEAMANGMSDVFYAALMDQLIEMKGDFVTPPEP